MIANRPTERSTITTPTFTISNLSPIAPREPVWSLYLAREALPAQPGGWSAEVELADGGRLVVSRLDGESAWIADGAYTAACPSFPVYFNGTGSRCTILKMVSDPTIAAALDAAVEALS